MQTQYNVLSYRIDLYFHDYQLALEIYENGHSDRNIDYEIQRSKEIEQKLKLTRVDSDEGHFDIFKTVNKIFRH